MLGGGSFSNLEEEEKSQMLTVYSEAFVPFVNEKTKDVVKKNKNALMFGGGLLAGGLGLKSLIGRKVTNSISGNNQVEPKNPVTPLPRFDEDDTAHQIVV